MPSGIAGLLSSPIHPRISVLTGSSSTATPMPSSRTILLISKSAAMVSLWNSRTNTIRGRLSKQMGQLERLVYKREHGQELFAGGRRPR